MMNHDTMRQSLPESSIREILVIGAIDRPEFVWALGEQLAIRPVRNTSSLDGFAQSSATAKQTSGTRESVWKTVASVPEAIAAIDSGQTMPDLILLVQPYPQYFSDLEIESLRRRLPLARLTLVFGSWCEGESRSSRPTMGVFRVAWHQWPFHLGRQRFAQAAGEPCAWELPPTVAPEEWLAAGAKGFRREIMGTVGIVSIVGLETAALAHTHGNPNGHHSWQISSTPSTYGFRICEVLAEACAKAGVSTLYLYPAAKSDCKIQRSASSESHAHAGHQLAAGDRLWFRALIVQVDDLDARCRVLLGRLAADYPGVPIAVVAGFPRIDQAVAAAANGVSAVLAKPPDLADLVYWLQCCTSPRPIEREESSAETSPATDAFSRPA